MVLIFFHAKVQFSIILVSFYLKLASLADADDAKFSQVPANEKTVSVIRIYKEPVITIYVKV